MTIKWIRSSIPIVAACVSLTVASFGPANASVVLQQFHAESRDIGGMSYSSGSITTMIDGSDFAITPDEWWELYGFDSDSTVVVEDNSEPGSVVIGDGAVFVDVIHYPSHEYPFDLGDGIVVYLPNWVYSQDLETLIDPGGPNVETVPLPGAIVLMGSAIVVLLGLRRVRPGGRASKIV